MDVPAIKQLKYQQSFFEFLDVPQIQHRDRYAQCKLCRKPAFHSAVLGSSLRDCAENCGGSAVAVGAVLGTVLTCPLLYYNRCLVVQTVQKTLEVPQLQFIDVKQFSVCSLRGVFALF